MPSYGRRVDPDGTQHKAVADAIDYNRVAVLWAMRVGNGTMRCELVRGDRPAKRIVRIVAEYQEAGVWTTRVVQCNSPDEERLERIRLERIILEASRKPER